MVIAKLDFNTYQERNLAQRNNLSKCSFVESGEALIDMLRKKAMSLNTSNFTSSFILPALSVDDQRTLLQMMTDHQWTMSIGHKKHRIDEEQCLEIPYSVVIIRP